MTKNCVYCSGPFYSPEETESMAELAAMLEGNGYQTFLPHRDGIEAYFLKAKDAQGFNQETELLTEEAIFALDVYQIIERCGSLVFNMNGRVPDEGSVFKTALAFATGKPLLIYKNDNRSTFHGNDNSMITGLSYTFSTISNLKEIPKELEEVAKKVASEGENPYAGENIPPSVRTVIDLGRKIWGFVEDTLVSHAKEEEYPTLIGKLAAMCKASFPAKQLDVADLDVTKKKVYCSGPLFCPEEMGVMSKIARIVEESGYETYLPHRDGVEAFVMNAVDSPIANAYIFKPFNIIVNKAVFAFDIYQIVDKCDTFVFNMNGRVPDEGGVVETAVAFAAGKPIVIYKNDQRTAFNGKDCPVVIGTTFTFSTVDTIERIPKELENAAKKIASQGESSYRNNIPPLVLKTVGFGYWVQKMLNLIQPLKPKNVLLERKA